MLAVRFKWFLTTTMTAADQSGWNTYLPEHMLESGGRGLVLLGVAAVALLHLLIHCLVRCARWSGVVVGGGGYCIFC